MAERIERFKLPRDDWYDEAGRIYKDAIIENLNACESKLLEMAKLEPVGVTPPDISSVVYPDVTLSSDEDCIVNLRSLANILNFKNYLIEINTSATTVLKAAYFDDNLNYVVLTNATVDGLSSANKYVYIDKSTQTIKASSSPNTALSGIFVGVYDGSIIRTIHDNSKVNLNLMCVLSNMDFTSGSFTRSNDQRGSIQSMYNSGRTVAFYNGESRASSHTGHYTDYGD